MEIENIKKNQPELKSTISEMKNTLKGVNMRLDEKEDPISNLDDKVVENTQLEQQK